MAGLIFKNKPFLTGFTDSRGCLVLYNTCEDELLDFFRLFFKKDFKCRCLLYTAVPG